MLEVCNDGGRMVDFGSAHGDYFSITDAYDPISNRWWRSLMQVISPAAMLEDLHRNGRHKIHAGFRYSVAQRHDGLALDHAGHEYVDNGAAFSCQGGLSHYIRRNCGR